MSQADPTAAAPRSRAVPRAKREASARPVPRAKVRRKKAAPPREIPPDPAHDISPSRYIARVDRRTGQERPGPIEPDELLVHAHRDQHPVEVIAQFLGSRVLQITGRERLVESALRRLNALGEGAAEMAGAAMRNPAIERLAKKLMGVVNRDVSFKFREFTHLSEKEVKSRVERLQREARTLLRARGRRPRLRVLLTGATGFLGKEILSQAADDRRIEEIVAVVRPETIRDHKTKEVLKVLTAAQRGALLLKRLHIAGAKAKKFRFIAGDIEKPDLGIDPQELAHLRPVLTHVVHCAASVSFDDTYENSFRANVLGCRNALAFALSVQKAPAAAFVSHVAIETSYIHGRKRRSIAQENALVFPRHFYNNFYELTKAMASIETDRFLIDEGLRVTQLLPSIVIGDSRTGNNRGDTKVVNAPINAFGRAKEAVDRAEGELGQKVRARLVAMVALGFPGDETAELNLVPVDRVVAGILAALTVPEAIGHRVHLATDNRIRSADMVRITREELGANVRLSDPTLYRNVTLPLVKATLTWLKEPKLAGALEKLGTIFGAYGEWGQPIHGVGNDVRLLGLPLRRPNTQHAFRMLCRHNRYVQEYGRLRDADETARRERVWVSAIEAIEHHTGHEIGALPAADFQRLIDEEIDLRAFRLRSAHAEGRRATRVLECMIRTAWILPAVLAVAGAAAAADAPDLILAGGKVFTSDPARPWAEAVAIAGDRIVAVGSSADVRPLAGSATRVIELQKRVVVPGFNDAHMHLGGGLGPGVNLALRTNDPAFADVLAALTTEAARAPAGTWLRGEIGVRVLDDPAATRATLDAITPNHPVLLTGWTGHGGLVNTAALRALGVADDEPDPAGGWFGRVRGTSQLSGIAHEYALFRLERRLGERVPHADAVANVRRYVQEALRLGITSAQDMGTSLPAPALADLLREAGSPLRWRVMRFSLERPSTDDASEGKGRDDKDGVVVWGRKWILDGTPVERLAATRRPYADRPAWTGRLDFPPEEIRVAVERARRDGEQVLFHVAGDAAASAALSALEAAGGPEVWRPLRPRFEHGDGLAPDLVARAAALGVTVVQNPSHFTIPELMFARFGYENMAGYQPMKSLLAAGVPLALGSDGPPSPFLNILFAVTHPTSRREALTREQAVTAYTRGSAFAEFAEKDKGTLAPGMLADLAVLSQDVFTVEEGHLPETVSVLTVIGGRVVYDAPVTPPERSPR